MGVVPGRKGDEPLRVRVRGSSLRGLLGGQGQGLARSAEPSFLLLPSRFQLRDWLRDLKLIPHSKCCHQPKRNHLFKHAWLQHSENMGFRSNRD